MLWELSLFRDLLNLKPKPLTPKLCCLLLEGVVRQGVDTEFIDEHVWNSGVWKQKLDTPKSLNYLGPYIYI